ncbi:MAG: hypothetical protein IJ661_05345 [Lachnospiraceae bacterium]|nr:hypothetical protein [Lachnospiraceae bacterium]
MELGSNYDLDITQLNEVSNNVQSYLGGCAKVYTDSGRSAIRFLLQKCTKVKVLLPSYICRSVVDCFDEGWDIEYYTVNERLEADMDEVKRLLDSSVGIIYVMHYFGILQGREFLDYIIEKKKQYNYIILEDTTHSFLTGSNKIGDYIICSLRKWFPIPDGGVLYSYSHELPQNELPNNGMSATVTEAMLMKYLYLQRGADCNQEYRDMFARAEKELDNREGISCISDMSAVLLDYFDIDLIAERRRENWNYLQENMNFGGIIPVYRSKANSFVPFTFPVMVEDRDNFRKYMIENKIYCAIHWPMETEEQQQIEMNRRIGQHIISLPIDQRYSIEEMRYMVKIMKRYDTMI